MSKVSESWEQSKGSRNNVRHNGAMELKLDNKTTPQMLLERLVKKGIVVNRFELSTPSLTEIFIKVVGDEHE